MQVNSPNQHIVSYLNDYLDKDNKNTEAVLLTGSWGTGKTHFIKDYLKEKEHLYISLYGLTSIKDIQNEIFIATHPAFKSKAGRIGTVLIGSLLNAGLRLKLSEDTSTSGKLDPNSIAGILKNINLEGKNNSI